MADKGYSGGNTGEKAKELRGLFLSFEGPEACGKSTQVELLGSRFSESGREVVKVREPGGTRTGELIRKVLQHDLAKEPIVPEAEALLFAASRAQLVQRVIRPALRVGKVVIADRFVDSTTVYQGYARGLGVDAVTKLNDFAVGNCMPEITFLLDVEIDRGFKRLKDRQANTGRGYDRMERAGREFHAKVRSGYLDIAAKRPERLVVLDGSQSAAQLHSEIWHILNKIVFSKRGGRES